jgi:predicted naringenin-chalcone synthase
MATFIHAIETAVPRFRFSQAEARDRLKAQWNDRRARKIAHRIYDASEIETRHSVVEDWGSESPEALFRAGPDGKWVEPSTAERNDVFAGASRRISVELAARLLRACPQVAAGDVTHVITASCTGFYCPGPDFYIVHELGLNPSVERYHLGFMGCYAAIPALRMARQFCVANPAAVVLVVCLELCSLHLQLDGRDIESLVAGALFSDGAAAALVSARSPRPGSVAYRLGRFESTLLPAAEQAMTWTLGDRGFKMSLSSYLPDLLGANIQPAIEPLLQSQGLTIRDVDHWAIHPGGKAILDKVGDALALRPEQLGVSRSVLRQYGNMSSATVLFVLAEFMRQAGGAANEQPTLAAAFGPGLTVETALMTLVGMPMPSREPRRQRDRASCGVVS